VQVDHVVGEVTVPPNVTPEKCTTHIIDSSCTHAPAAVLSHGSQAPLTRAMSLSRGSALPEDRDKLDREVRKANVVCVVYSVVDQETFERVTSYWLPYMRRLGVNVRLCPGLPIPRHSPYTAHTHMHTHTHTHTSVCAPHGSDPRTVRMQVPVVLVGNKIDLRSTAPPATALDEEITPIMTEWKEVETCVECSAKTVFNVSEAFYFAQKAVLHPTPPLYDAADRVR
jgi:mitochondrial Rho GTPase 1